MIPPFCLNNIKSINFKIYLSSNNTEWLDVGFVRRDSYACITAKFLETHAQDCCVSGIIQHVRQLFMVRNGDIEFDSISTEDFVPCLDVSLYSV